MNIMYSIISEGGQEMSTGIQSEQAARAAAQRSANDLSETVTLCGPNCSEEEISPNAPMSRMAYVRDEDNVVERIIGRVVDGSIREARLSERAPAGCSLVVVDDGVSVGDTLVVDERGVAS